MIDLHTHILPGMDDGSRSAEMSLAMLRRQWEQGVDTVVLTPHFYRSREHLDRFLQRREAAWRVLEAAIAGETEALPALFLGAEVAWAPDMPDWEEISQVCIGCGQYMLLEMPFTPWGDQTIRVIYDLMRRRGVTPVIAHLERYVKDQDPALVREILGMGVPVQVSAAPVLLPFKRRTVLKMLRTGQAQLLASDCHNLETRPPNLAQAVEQAAQRLGPGVAWTMEQQGRKILGQAQCLFPGRGR